MYNSQHPNFIRHDYLFQSVKAGIITEKFADNIIAQLNKIYYTKGVKKNV